MAKEHFNAPFGKPPGEIPGNQPEVMSQSRYKFWCAAQVAPVAAPHMLDANRLAEPAVSARRIGLN